MSLWQYAEAKKKARQFVLPGFPVRSGIWLPADKALCVREVLKAGSLRTAKNVILVEENPTIYDKMIKATDDIPNRRLFCGKLSKLKIDHPIDYVFLDFLGGVNQEVAKWMTAELSSNLTEGATVCITQMLAARNNKLLGMQDEYLKSNFGAIIRREYGVQSKAIQRILLVMHRIFRGWAFDVVPDDEGGIYTYRDSVTTMMLLKLVNFRKVDPIFPLLEL